MYGLIIRLELFFRLDMLWDIGGVFYMYVFSEKFILLVCNCLVMMCVVVLVEKNWIIIL